MLVQNSTPDTRLIRTLHLEMLRFALGTVFNSLYFGLVALEGSTFHQNVCNSFGH